MRQLVRVRQLALVQAVEQALGVELALALVLVPVRVSEEPVPVRQEWQLAAALAADEDLLLGRSRGLDAGLKDRVGLVLALAAAVVAA